MEAFFVRVMVAVMTNDKVQAMLHNLIHDATKDGLDAIAAKVDGLADHLVDRVDGLDGKMGNLQEQFTQIPGQVIGGVIEGVVGQIKNLFPHIPGF